MLNKLFIALLLIGGLAVRAQAARIELLPQGSADQVNLILISGEINAGDFLIFEQIATPLSSKTAVLLNSPGGNLIHSLAIGAFIQKHHFVTVVGDNGVCASSCGLIWLAGVERLASDSAGIGFHVAYSGRGENAKTSGTGNALVGAYLSELGFSFDVIAFVTSAEPDDMQWLHHEEATRLGIIYTVLASKSTAAKPVQAKTREQRAIDLVLAYYADWSKSSSTADILAKYYGETVAFYGPTISRGKLMDEKNKFSARWPIRQYTVKPGTLFAVCADVCAITGVVEWDVSSRERHAHSVGTANIVLKIALAGSSGLITAENGSVLNSHLDDTGSAVATTQGELSPDQQAASTTSAYADGRAARVAYEAWVEAVPEGAYRNGLLFWAGNRSLKPQPTCLLPGSSFDWQAGCHAAQGRLSPIDARRTTDRNYWLGWNSL